VLLSALVCLPSAGRCRHGERPIIARSAKKLAPSQQQTRGRLPIIGLQSGRGSATIGANATRAIHLQRLIDALQVKFSALRGLEVARLGAVAPRRPVPALAILPPSRRPA
jgi:hypothetical protein